MIYSIIFILVIFSSLQLNDCLEGKNVCFENQMKIVEKKVDTTKVIVKETFGWCWTKIPPRCRKKKTITITQSKMVPKVTYEKVETCCEGYVRAVNICIPICLNQCYHGKCIGPNECECSAGWGGNSCNITCEGNKWGPKCSNECNCKNGSRCDPINGHCVCSPGYLGTDCVHQCDCFNGGKCDEKTGICDCPSGYSGNSCEAKCSTGSYGRYCSQVCNCNNNNCNFITGECYCLEGYSGEHCQKRNCSIIDCNNNFSTNELLREESSKASIAPIILIACFLCIVIFVVSAFLILKNKKKIHELKNELAYVSYSADKPQDRFDNPIYAYPNFSNSTSSSINTPSPNIPMMVKTINNDLSICKNNLHKQKLDNLSEDNYGACGGDDTFSNKINNDNNLNIYHNIDDKKTLVDKEPIYDEIPYNKTHEKVLFEENEDIDHLHYDQPKLTIRSNFNYPKDKS